MRTCALAGCLSFAAALIFVPAVSAELNLTPGGRVTRYVDPAQQSVIPFGMRSHWLQPWRAYLETVPAARLREAVGINLNVGPDEAEAVCRHLAANGFCKVRIEFGWGSVSWEDPKRLADPGRFDRIVAACKRHGLRPLFLLNAHHGVPCPVRFFDVRLVEPARKGDRAVRIDPASLSRLVPGRSGLCGLTDYWAAEVLFTKVNPELTPADADRMKAKATLRYLVSYVNKGPVRFYFFAAKDDNPLGLGLVSNEFFKYLKAHGNQYPADDALLTSSTMRAVRRLVEAMPGGTAISKPRSIELAEIAEDHGHRQFDGDPATATKERNPHPPLYNRDVLGFFPFQIDDRRFVVPVYVMTRNLARLYRPEAPSSDPGRFDLPAEPYRLTLGGLRGDRLSMALFDLLDGKDCPLRTLRAGPEEIVIEVPLTDSPRLLKIEERP